MDSVNSVKRGQPYRGVVTPAIQRIDVDNLFGGSRELILVHKDSEYRLRLTRNDKLILTK